MISTTSQMVEKCSVTSIRVTIWSEMDLWRSRQVMIFFTLESILKMELLLERDSCASARMSNKLQGFSLKMTASLQ